MISFSGPVEAVNALEDYLYDRTDPLPSELRDELRMATRHSSKVRATTDAVEFIYANRDGLPQSILEWAAAAAVVCEFFAFNEMDVDYKGSRMARVMLGETVDDPPEADKTKLRDQPADDGEAGDE